MLRSSHSRVRANYSVADRYWRWRKEPRDRKFCTSSARTSQGVLNEMNHSLFVADFLSNAESLEKSSTVAAGAAMTMLSESKCGTASRALM